jgi:hypothetical protein
MTKVAHLRVIDANGEVVEHEDIEQENRALRAALTRAENVIKGLRANLAAERQQARKAYPIDEAFEDWKAKLVTAGLKGKKQCKLGDSRIDAMSKMFVAGYTLEDFQHVNTGLAYFQFVVYGKRRQHGSDDAREVDIGYVCEKERRFEEAARLGVVVEKALAA